MANYVIDPSILLPYLPCRTELDDFEGRHYASLVGFLFENTRVKGLSIPFHRNFEEVNLRFYVRYKEKDGWKRGVVFMKEIVPKRMISFVANTLYGENYVTLPMRHQWELKEDGFHAGYEWRRSGRWNHLSVVAEAESTPAAEGSPEEFITEHYWGYTRINQGCTGVYEVRHPRWNIHRVLSHSISCDAGQLYGPEFEVVLEQAPASVFLADGSDISVHGKEKLYKLES